MKSLLKLNIFLWKYKWKLSFGFLLVILSNYVQVFSINYIRDGINTIQELLTLFNTNQNTDLSALKYGLMVSALSFIGLKALSGLFTVGTRQMIIVTSRLIEFDLKNEIYKQYQRLSLSFYKKNKTGDLMNRITEDVSFVRMYLGPGIMYPIDLISRTFILFFFMIQIDWELTLYTLAPLPILSILIYNVAAMINRKSKHLQEQQSQISSTVQDTFSGIRVIKSFNTEKFVQDKYLIDAEQYEKRALSLAQTQAFFGPLMILVVGVSNLVILYLGGIRYVEGKLDIGVIGQFFMYLNMLIWPFTSLGWVTMLVQRASASMTRINEFLQQTPEILNTIDEKHPIRGDIEFKQVNFTYDNTGIKALNNVSFKVKAGETLAILGKTGSGKSTIALLIARLLQPSSGTIWIDGKSIEETNLYSLREHIGYVPQEAFLFSDNILNNIMFASDDKDIGKAKIFAKKAVVHNNIVNFKEDYNTVIGERGVTLSGGQKQRISIARALVKEPSILIFDDSLSAVDTETEEMILQNLEKDLSKKTSIIITHRISSAKNANQILILDEGKIIEKGTHLELLSAKGTYYNLYQKQLSDK